MSTPTASPTHQLKFEKIESGYHYAHGLLTDRTGNSFRVEIKGTDFNRVNKFMKYLLRQTKKGKGITTQINRLSPRKLREVTELGAKASKVTKGPKLMKADDPQNLHVTLELLAYGRKMNGPHQISFDVDPQLLANQGVTYNINYQSSVNIQCKVKSGSVQVQLWATQHVGGPVATQTVSAGQSVTLNKSYPAPTNWTLELRGIVAAYYTLKGNLNVNK